MQTAASGVPRFDNDPVTHQPRGLLMEEARTNLVLNSGVLVTQSVTTTAAATTLSFYGTGSVTLSGTFAGTVNGTGATTRTVSTFTPTAGTLTLTVSGSVTNAQVEAGSFVTSYIPTAGATATRAADIATMPLTGWYNASAGTFAAEFMVNQPAAAGTQEGILRVDDTTASNVITMYINVSGNIAGLITNAGTNQYNNFLNPGGAVLTFPAQGKGALNYGVVPHAAYNGGLGQIGSGALAPVTPTRLIIGASSVSLGSWNLDGWIRRIRYWNRALTDAELVQVTK
jgi:hypothetical protein